MMRKVAGIAKKNWFRILLICEALILVLAVVRYVHDSKTLEKYHFDAEDFDLQNGDISEDTSYYLITQSGEGPKHFLFGPYHNLSRGSYRVTAHYSSTAAGNENMIWVYSDEAQSRDILGDVRYMNNNENTLVTDFYLTTTVKKIQYRVIFMDEGELDFYGVDVEETMAFDNVLMAGLIVVLLLVPLCIQIYRKRRKLFGEVTRETKHVLLGLVAVTLAACGPCFMDYTISSHDFIFHIVRIEGIKDGWLAGQFPTRIQPTWFHGLGYASSVFYGDILLWPSAFLRLLGLPVQYCYQFLQVLINVLTCAVTYNVLKRMVRNRYSALFGTVIYMLAPYRMENLYLRNAVGEASAMIFLPLVVYGMWLILTKEASAQQKKRKWLPLAIGMTGLVQTHILTFEMVLVLVIIVALTKIVRIFREKRIFDLIKAAGVAVLLNAWFLLPFLQFFGGDYKVTTQKPAFIQTTGAYLNQLFMFSSNYNKTSSNLPLSEGIGTEMPLSVGLGFGIAIVLILAITCSGNRKKDARLRLSFYTVILGIICLLMASNMFPWDAISKLGEIPAKMVSSLQFVWRFLSPATVLLVVATTLAIDYGRENMNQVKITVAEAVVGVLILLQGFYLTDTWIVQSSTGRIYNIEALDLNYASSGNEYIPANAVMAECFKHHTVYSTENTDVVNVEIDGTNVSFKAVNSGEADCLVLPLLNYPGYRARWVETGQTLTLTNTEYQMLAVEVPAGFVGNIEVRYVGRGYWRITDVISVLTLICLCGYPLYRRKRSKKNTRSVA